MLGMQALLKRAGSMLRRPATPYIFRIQTMHSLRQETKVEVDGTHYKHTFDLLEPENKIVVEGLASTVDDRILREAFSPYGDVKEARVVLDVATGLPIGKVTYREDLSCDWAIASMHQWELHGQTVRVSWVPPPCGNPVDLDEGEAPPFTLVHRKVPPSLSERWKAYDYNIISLAPGMILLKSFLSLLGQADIVNICQKRAMGPGGFYTPRSPSGHKLALRMMCYGRQWDPVARYGKHYRSDDGSNPPPIPDEFMSFVKLAFEAADITSLTICPDICVANHYTAHGRLALHQDCDESSDSLESGSPVVSVSIGDSADFWYGPTRDEIKKVRLDSGDVLIFGGKSRLYFHGVREIIPWTAPRHVSIDTGLIPGRLNLTFRKY